MEVYNCKNCGSSHTVVSNNAYVAPFFAKRVFGVDGCVTLDLILNKYSGTIDKYYKKTLFRMAYSILKFCGTTDISYLDLISLKTDIIICRECFFVGPKINFSKESLSRLYLDYREVSYNDERIVYEPSYAFIKDNVGKGSLEYSSRIENLEILLQRHIDAEAIVDVLDYGGGDGKFIPPMLTKKNVTICDISSEVSVNLSYHRINNLIDNDKYDYIQICHVLEHVGEPRSLIQMLMQHLRPQGIIYIEVPEDRSSSYVSALLSGEIGNPHILHEHINLYTTDALSSLGRSLKLEEICVQQKQLNLGWCKMTVISGLFRIQ